MVICPKCKSNKIIPIMYGMPTHEAFEEAEKGNIKMGGCMIREAMPDRYCTSCKYEWSVDTLSPKYIKKIRYKVIENGLCCTDSAGKWVYEIDAAGVARYYEYRGRLRKAVFKETGKVSKKSVKDLFAEINEHTKPQADIIIADVCDGYSYQLQITYEDNRKKILTGDCGGGTIDGCLDEFFRKVPEFKY